MKLTPGKYLPLFLNGKTRKDISFHYKKRILAAKTEVKGTPVGDNFANLSEALYTAERKANANTEVRDRISLDEESKNKERKAAELHALSSGLRFYSMRCLEENKPNSANRPTIEECNEASACSPERVLRIKRDQLRTVRHFDIQKKKEGKRLWDLGD